MSSGIYKIENQTNGNFYIGSSRDIGRRRQDHKRDLRRRTHHNPVLQRAWDKCGESSFVFSTVLLCSTDDLSFFEQRCIDKLRPAYNLIKTSGDTGWCHDEGTKEKLRTQAKKLWRTPKMRARSAACAELRAKKKAISVARTPTLKLLFHDGFLLSYEGWAKKLGVTVQTVKQRIKNHNGDLSIALAPSDVYKDVCDRRAIEISYERARKYSAHGKILTLSEWSRLLNIRVTTLYNRIHIHGVPIEDALVPTMMSNAGKGNAGKKRSAEVIKRASRKIVFRGEVLTIGEWAKRIGITKSALTTRLDRLGWSLERALTTPEIKGRPPLTISVCGQELTVAEIAQRCGMTEKTVYKRLANGESAEVVMRGRKRVLYTYAGESLTYDEWAIRFGVSAQAVCASVHKHGEHEGLRRLHERWVGTKVVPQTSRSVAKSTSLSNRWG